MGKSMEELLRLARQVVVEAELDAEKNPTSEEIQVVVVEPEKKPYKKIIQNKFEEMQKIVGGYIARVSFGKTESGGTLKISVNEEGKLMDLPFNRMVIGKGGTDMLVGTFFISAFNKQGDNIGLKDVECARMIKKFSYLEVYL